MLWWSPWNARQSDMLEAQIVELRHRIALVEVERTNHAVDAARWQARYEELARWLEHAPQHPVPVTHLSLDTDPFAEVPEEKLRLARLFLSDPEVAMAEAAGDGATSRENLETPTPGSP